MAPSVVSRVLVGPYGTQALGFAALAVFLAFIWVFNFTSFF